MSSPPTSKRIKTSIPPGSPQQLLSQQQAQQNHPFQHVPSYEGIPMPQTQIPGSNPRKRRSSPPSSTAAMTTSATGDDPVAATAEPTPRKKGRTNTPWTAEEEQRLKTMRDAGRSWSEIAKTFPNRTEGSVKKHWYKDMHYAEFAEDESIALREAIKEYEGNKWKVIGQKVGKPAKACEQYAKEHFKDL
ncbi:Putative Myb-like transcription factor [Aspergillus calidoustus]|uniref:Putative Myb-like transcription factor n=1 Tax=Aspergillus calidoustus TaxID=454130 RepID=A0A0U4YZN3_ASPCI|nr:Putative Myb-like transcription factor [Aspergillus calidoustus]